jgi:hypothetical protein
MIFSEGDMHLANSVRGLAGQRVCELIRVFGRDR